MKKILAIIAVATLINLAAFVAAQTNTQPTREFNIPVNASTNIFAHNVRVTISDCTFEATTLCPLPTYNIELWATNVTPNVIVAKYSYAVTNIAQLKAVVTAADPKATIIAAVLGKVNLTAKP